MRRSRATSVAVALWALAFGPACGALDHFETEMVDEATIPGTVSAAAPFALDYKGSFNGVNLAAEKSFQNAGVKPSDVDAIFVESVRIEGANPSIDRLDVILDTMEVWVEADGVMRATIATLHDVPMSASAVDLVVQDPKLNLRPYAVAPTMKVGANLKLKQRPAFTTTIRTRVKLLVDINLLGS